LLLSPLAYFHAIHFESITVGGSGKWLKHLLQHLVFRGQDASQDSAVKNLERRLSAWLADANFVAQIADVSATAQVPLSTAFDITTLMHAEDFMMYRTMPAKVDLKQVVRLGGADMSITTPSFLLPHHEHIMPPRPSPELQAEKQEHLDDTSNAGQKSPKKIQAKQELEQESRDETNLTISAHARLPAVFDQELLDFIAALVKATKMIELEHGPQPDPIKQLEESASDGEIDDPKVQKRRTFMEMARSLEDDFTKSFKRVAVDAVTNDRWIAKLVGKTVRRLEDARGYVGYTGLVPIPLAPYRAKAEDEIKLLP
jgi:protein-tyrosine-phosphatase